MNILETTNIQTRKSSINAPVLILNQDYTPLGICLAKRAIVLIFSEKAETVINSDNSIKSISKAFLVPSVIKILKYIKRPYEKKISRFGILARDNFTCQYCNHRFSANELTFDHLTPRCKNGKTIWHNVVSACTNCNLKKGRRLLKKTEMKLFRKPIRPTVDDLHRSGRNFPPNFLHESWMDYLYWDVELEP